MEKYMDPGVSAGERAKDLLGKMSLEEKMRRHIQFFLGK